MPGFADVLPQNAKPTEHHGNFDLIKKFKLDFADIHVSKWKSRTSGLSVVHLDYDGMSIGCVQQLWRLTHVLSSSTSRQWLFCCRNREYEVFLAFALHRLTSFVVFNDSGCPHTLEQYVQACFIYD